MKECGRGVLSTAVVNILGIMEWRFKDIFGSEKGKEKEHYNIQMGLASRAIGETTYDSKTISIMNTKSRVLSVKIDFNITHYYYEKFISLSF